MKDEMIVIEGHVGSRFCRQADSRASSARLVPQHHPLLSWRTVARIAPSLDSGQKVIRRLFRDETKPSKHRFKHSGQIRRTFLQVNT